MRLNQTHTPEFWIFRVDDLIAHFSNNIDVYNSFIGKDIEAMAKGLCLGEEKLRSIAQRCKDSGKDIITVQASNEYYPEQDARDALRDNGYYISFNHLASKFAEHNAKADHSKLYPAAAFYDMDKVIETNTQQIKTHQQKLELASASYVKEFHSTLINALEDFNDAAELSHDHPTGAFVAFERSHNHDHALESHLCKLGKASNNDNIFPKF